jgi:hypothetical protein
MVPYTPPSGITYNVPYYHFILARLDLADPPLSATTNALMIDYMATSVGTLLAM